MSWREDVLRTASEWEKKTGRKRSGAASEIMNDAKFFDRIEDGGGCTVDTLERVERWFKENLRIRNNNAQPN